jgi:hypothetical protein
MANLKVDKLQLTGQNMGQVFNSKNSCMFDMHLLSYEAKRPYFKLKTQPPELLGQLPLAFGLTGAL